MGYPHGRKMLIPMTVFIPGSLLLLDKIAEIPIPVKVKGVKIYSSLRAMTLGTVTLRIKNAAGTQIAQMSWTAAGIQSATFANEMEAEDKFVLQLTGIGVGASDLFTCIWVIGDTSNG